MIDQIPDANADPLALPDASKSPRTLRFFEPTPVREEVVRDVLGAILVVDSARNGPNALSH